MFRRVILTTVFLSIIALFSLMDDGRARLDGAWNWFTNPRALSRGEFIYTGYVGHDGDVIISSIDRRNGDISSKVLHRGLDIDDHANPAILFLPDGRLTAFYSAHNGKYLFQRTAIFREDIEWWGPERRVAVNSAGAKGYTYPNPVLIEGHPDTLYLFWRGADWQPTFATSTDYGDNWGEARTLIRVPGERPYVLYEGDEDKIHVVFSNGHPRETKTSLYYMYYENGVLYRADGSIIKTAENLPVVPEEADIIYDADLTKTSSWAWDLAVDDRGKPVIVYAVFPKGEHRYRYVTFGGHWKDHEFATGGGYIGTVLERYYSGGIALDHSDPNVIFFSKKQGDSFRIEKAIAPKNNGVWTFESVEQKGNTENIRPIVPRGESGSVLWLTGDYEHYSRYNTSIDHLIWP